MTTKEKVLELFESSRDVYLSGEDIAHKLSISRASVWKAVKALQNEGYAIDAVTNNIVFPIKRIYYRHRESANIYVPRFKIWKSV